MRRTALPALLVVLALGVAGCGEDEPARPGVQVGDDSAKSTPEPSDGSAPSSAPSATPDFDDKTSEVLRGTVEADTPEKVAVSDAWFAYWESRVRSYSSARVDPGLGAVAAADALADVVGYVALLKSKNLRTVGDTKFSVRDVDLQGNSAKLQSCMVNKSVDRAPDGSPAEQITPFYQLEGTLTKVAGAWRVVQVTTLGKDRCEA